ncbi:MAG: mechanosensitive ion channel domain-containing protein [Bacillota bacterium]
MVKLLGKLLDNVLPVTRMSPSVISLIRSLVTLGCWVLAFSATLQALGLTQIALALGGSLALVAMALAGAASGLVTDIIAEIFLVADPDFNVGEIVEVAGTTGVVRSIDMTRTRTLSGEKLYLVPNRALQAGNIIVHLAEKQKGS